MKKETNIHNENSIEEDQVLPVYEGEIIDEYENKNTKIEKKNDKPPVGKLAYRLGKTAGSLIAVLGFINEIRHVFKGSRTGSEAGKYGSGKEKRGPIGGRRRRGGMGRMKRRSRDKSE
jgi:hypothetical protein